VIFPRNRRAHRALRLAASAGALSAAFGVAIGFGAALPASLQAQAVTEVQVTPETMTLGVNGKQPIFAAAYDRQGNLIPSAKFTFWSSDTSIVQVRRDGTVLGMRPGLAKVEARSGGRRASLAVLITASTSAEGVDDRLPPGAVLTLEPAGLVLLPRETGRFALRATREDGSPLALGRVMWKSLTPEVATVDGGTVTALAAGRSSIQATTSGGLLATAPVEVAPAEFVLTPARLVLAPAAADTIRVRVPTQGDRRLAGDIRWRTLDSTVATVGPSGVVRAARPGKTEIVATGFGQERRAAVTVHKVPEALVVSPRQSGRIQIPRNGRRKFSAVAEAADSTPIPEIAVTWTLRDSTAAMFDPASGTLTAKAVGTTTLTARIAGFAPAVWRIEVIPGLVHLTRDRVGLLPGASDKLAAVLRDDAGQAVGEMSELRWTSDRPDIAAVAPDGTVHAAAPGRTTIVATTPWGQSDTAVVFVTSDLLVTSNRGGTFGVYGVLRAKPDSFLPIVADRAANIDGVYSPDRTQLAFSSDRGGNFDLYIADADGANARQLTAGPGDETDPVWMPDGTRLFFTAVEPRPGANPHIYAVDAGGGTARVPAFSTGGGSSVAVAADSQTVAFVSTRDKDKDPDLYVVADGEPRRITDDAGRELFPQFLPNGDLLYAVERGRGKTARLMRRSLMADDGTKLFDTDGPLAALDISRDGTLIAYAVGKVTDAAKGRARFGLYLRPLTPEGRPIYVPLRPDEQISSIAF
jgi:Tol biopolymer transport system component